MWRSHNLKERYDVVIIGAGVHGLATAYYLGKIGGKSIAVLDKSYLGGGGSGRNTAILRANYVSAEGIPFYRKSLELYEGLSQELDFNLLFSQIGRLEIAHSDAAIYSLRRRAEANVLFGVDSRIVSAREVKRLAPAIDLRSGKRLPIVGGLYHPPGGVIRHDAVVWGFARGADRFGAELHPHTDVTGIIIANGRVTGVHTNKGDIQADVVMSATAGWSSTIARMVDIELPIVTYPLEACVTEPLKPFMDKTISDANFHVYVYQTGRGEVVIGGAVNPYSTYSQLSTLPTLSTLAGHALEMFPCLQEASILRQWTGLCDITPDYAPIMSEVPGLAGLIISCGWGTWGFKAAPAGGLYMAEAIANANIPKAIRPFSLSRFAEGKLVNERAAAPAAALQ